MIQIDLPEELEKRLRQDLGDLDRAAKEALCLQAFREGAISHYELSEVLGLDRFETDDLLQRRGVTEGTLTFEDLEQQRETINRVLGPVRR